MTHFHRLQKKISQNNNYRTPKKLLADPIDARSLEFFSHNYSPYLLKYHFMYNLTGP